jgi:hypothetical protein
VSPRIPVWVAPHSVRFYEPGATMTDLEPGDVVLIDHNSWVAKGITVGEWLLSRISEPELRGYTWADHCALSRERDGQMVISEMGPRGHEFRAVSDYDDRLSARVRFDVSSELRERVLAADQRLHGIRYGFDQYPFLAVNGLTGAKIAASYGSAMVCSTAVTWCAKNIYFTPDRQDSAVIPAHITYWVRARR